MFVIYFLISVVSRIFIGVEKHFRRFKTEVQNFGREELILHSPSGGGCPSGGGGLNRTQERTFSTSN